MDARAPGREVELHLTGNMERYAWSLDGVEFGQSTPVFFKHGERLRVILHNDTMMTHPMHLHGMWSELETPDGSFQARRHTIPVQPAQRISFLVTADALGRWAWHCHLMLHMDAGMFRAKWWWPDASVPEGLSHAPSESDTACRAGRRHNHDAGMGAAFPWRPCRATGCGRRPSAPGAEVRPQRRCKAWMATPCQRWMAARCRAWTESRSRPWTVRHRRRRPWTMATCRCGWQRPADARDPHAYSGGYQLGVGKYALGDHRQLLWQTNTCSRRCLSIDSNGRAEPTAMLHRTRRKPVRKHQQVRDQGGRRG